MQEPTSKEQNLIPAPPDVFAKEWKSLSNAYEYIKQAGKGKTGVVYHIKDRKTGVSFGLKTVAPEITKRNESEKVRDSLIKEYEILAPLTHQSLPRIYQYDFKTTRPYYICTYHPGTTLQNFIRNGTKLKRDDAIFVTSLLINILEYLHQNGRTHNDLHLGNVLIDTLVLQHGILLIDFGSGHRESDSTDYTEVRGNIHFMPKRLKGMRERIVRRQEAAESFKISDFTALGHLLLSAKDAFFQEMSPAQRAALDAFCNRLIIGALSDWGDVKSRFANVIEPLRHVEAMRGTFFNEQGLQEAISVPVYGRVPIGPSWLDCINSERFQTLRSIKQLSFCDWFFPGARHSRFEHSLGVFHLMRRAVERLSVYSEFRDVYEDHDLNGSLFAALMHDIGHYPFAHLIEQYARSRHADNKEIQKIASHSFHSLSAIEAPGFCESFFNRHADKIREAAVATLDGNNGVLSDLMDGPADIDKMDYLRRDSHHCGIRFGEGLDPERLLDAIRLTPDGKLAISMTGVNAFSGFLILQNQMLGEVYWQEYVRALISMFHVAIAHIVKQDPQVFTSLIEDLKKHRSEEEAFKNVLYPRLSAVAAIEKKNTLPQLLELHLKSDFKSIYRCLKTYTRAGKPGPKRRVSVYHALVAPNLSGSQLPIDWKTARLLRHAFRDSIKELEIEAEDHEVIVDVPVGKTSQRSVDVLLDNNEVVPITSLSHIATTLFTEPAIFVSPVRVFVSPRIFGLVSSHIDRIVSAAEDRFYSAEESKSDHDSMIG